jgi:hypothetical protein
MRTIAALCLIVSSVAAGSAHAVTFLPSDLVVLVEGGGASGITTFADNQAAPITLMEFSTAGGAAVGSEVLPTTASGSNFAISGEYGSSSEGFLQLSGNGAYLTLMGYGVNYAAFNADPTAYGTNTTDPSKNTALGQSGSLTNAGYTAVPRVVALVNQDGVVDTSTAVYNVYNGNNPRSVYTANGTSFYISGQGNSPDGTGGVFYLSGQGVTTAPTQITGLDTSGKTSSQDTRFVTAYGAGAANTLYVSVDSKEGSGSNRDFVGALGSPPATTTYNAQGGPTQLHGFGTTSTGDVTITAQTTNGVNSAGKIVNLSPEEVFFASSTVMYVADSGDPKNGGGDTSGLGDGGLQKWDDVNGTWTLEYTLGLGQGLPLVKNSASSGTSGLFAVTGQYDPATGDEDLYVTTFSLTDTGATYLYEITDPLTAETISTASGVDKFNLLETAPADSDFKGVSFAPSVLEPAPEPGAWALLLVGVCVVGGSARSNRREGRAAHV